MARERLRFANQSAGEVERKRSLGRWWPIGLGEHARHLLPLAEVVYRLPAVRGEAAEDCEDGPGAMERFELGRPGRGGAMQLPHVQRPLPVIARELLFMPQGRARTPAEGGGGGVFPADVRLQQVEKCAPECRRYTVRGDRRGS